MLLIAEASAAESETVREPVTGFELPRVVSGQELVATSARSVTVLRFVTYAFALYVSAEQSAALHALAQTLAATVPAPVSTGDALAEALLSSTATKLVPLVSSLVASWHAVQSSDESFLV